MALIPTAAAHADSNDDQFVAAVNAAGLPGDRGALIGIAHEWCDAGNLPRIGAIGHTPWGDAIRHVSERLRSASGMVVAAVWRWCGR